MRVADAARAGTVAKIAATLIEALPADPQLMQAAISGGAAAFKVNCVQCHGAGAAGSAGYPNLNDDDWIWGGTLTEIEYTLTHGIRWDAAAETRSNYMPAFQGSFDRGQVNALAGHVLSLSGKAKPNAVGAQLFADNCAACHGPAGAGLPEVGGPALNDAIWLYGGSASEIGKQILAPRHGVMPAWQGRLDPVTIKMLAAYVHSRGGGQDPAPAATPTPQVASQ
jgi:cytochrome c oxidase cbb3-type subunit 3